MADSVDRVFGHALNTINKIRTGSTKPPVSDRLALYGLYKQSMEGSVRYIQSRPLGTDPQSLKEQEKYDAWASNEGLSRTEAKKRYIEKLIATMHSYASETQEARELVGELEFVWEQVRNNSQPSTGSEKSSPLMVQEGGAGGYMGAATSSVGGFETGRGREGGEGSERREGKLRVLSPVSQEREDEEEEKEEFVDAPVSQFGEQDIHTPSEERIEGLGPLAGEGSAAAQPRRSAPEDARWRRRVEGALIKMTTEVAALREQLESRRYLSNRRRHSLIGWVLRGSWFLIKLVVADLVVLWIVILYLRRKKDRRLEGAIRVLLGDAVAQVQKVGSQMKVPKLTTKKS